MSFLGASSGNTLSGQDLWCPWRGFGCCPWGQHQVLQGLLLDLFQVLFTSGFTSFAGKPVPHHHHSTAVFVCVYIYIYKYMYIHVHTYVYKFISSNHLSPAQCTHNSSAEVPAAANKLLPHSLCQALLQKSAGLNLGQRNSFPI